MAVPLLGSTPATRAAAVGLEAMVVIEVEALTKRYGETVALRHVHLAIEGGGIVGLLGPNGAGKTTLVEILEGLRLPSSGRVSVLGLDPTRQPRALKERIGVQLQSTAIPDGLTAAEVLRLFAAFYPRYLPVDEVLRRVQLEDRAGAVVRSLSGGQRQRLAVAMALVHDPELLILDEPTSGLDPAARRQLHRIVLELKGQGRTILWTTHYIEEAEQLCDRVIMIRAGEIVADGTPFDLVGKAGGRSTIWIAVDGAFDPAPLVAAGAEFQGRQGEHYRFSTADPVAAILALGELLRSRRLTLTDLRMRRPTLEDVYLELMAGQPGAAAEAAAASGPRAAGGTGTGRQEGEGG